MACHVGRWHSISSGLMMMLAAGTIYAFGVYSDQIKDNLDYTQHEIQSIGSAGNIGLYAALFGGLVYDAFGPAPTMAGGIVLVLAGYLLLYLAAIKAIMHPPWLVGLFMAVWANGSSWFDNAALATAVRNFPRHRGLVVGLLKSCFGLSASLVSQFYISFFRPDVNNFLLFLTIFLPCFSFANLPFVRLPPRKTGATETDEETPAAEDEGPSTTFKLLLAYVVTVLLGVVLVASSLLEHFNVVGSGGADALSGVVILIVLATAVYPYWVHSLSRRLARHDPHRRAPRPHGDGTPLLNGRGGGGGGEDGSAATAAAREPTGANGGVGGGDTVAVSVAAPPDSPDALAGGLLTPVDTAGLEAHPQVPLLQAVRQVDYWLLFIICAFAMGAGLVVINNISQIYEALHDTAASAPPPGAHGSKSKGATVFVSIISVCNCFGRMLAGALSDSYASRLTRPGFTVVACLLMGGAHALFAVANVPLLYPTCALAGLAYGALWALLPTMVADLYGLRHFGANYSFQALAPSMGSIGLSAELASHIYQSHTAPGVTDCYGHACYRATHLILVGGCILAALLALLLWARTRKFYARMRALREEAGAAVDTAAVLPAQSP